jgi:diguanylate cyclase (GGDEF)-like protein
LRSAIREQQLKVLGLLVPVTVSIGVSTITKAQQGTVDDLYTAADQALYAAKHGGRDRVEYRSAALPLER